MVKHRYGRGQQQQQGQQQQGRQPAGGEGAAPPGPSGGSEQAAGRALGWRDHLALELRHRGGYLPLMHLFPLSCARIPWSAEDQQLRKEWPQLSQGC